MMRAENTYIIIKLNLHQSAFFADFFNGDSQISETSLQALAPFPPPHPSPPPNKNSNPEPESLLTGYNFSHVPIRDFSVAENLINYCGLYNKSIKLMFTNKVMLFLDVAGTGKSFVEFHGIGHMDIVKTDVFSSLSASEFIINIRLLLNGHLYNVVVVVVL